MEGKGQPTERGQSCARQASGGCSVPMKSDYSSVASHRSDQGRPRHGPLLNERSTGRYAAAYLVLRCELQHSLAAASHRSQGRCLSTKLSAFLNGHRHFFWRPQMLPRRVQPDLFDVLPVARLP